MFEQFDIIKFQQQFKTLILKLQVYCVTHDIHQAGYNSLQPLVALNDQGLHDKLAKNHDLLDEIMKCQIKLQNLLELAENDRDTIKTKLDLDHAKPPANPTTPNNNDDTSQDLFSEDIDDTD